MFVSIGGSPDQYDNAQVPILHHDDEEDDDDGKHNCRFIQRQVGGWQ